MQFTTKTTYVDVETGEIITKDHVTKGHYIKIRTELKNTYNNGYRIERHYTTECRRNAQQQLQF